jgi:hypothetical protein
MNPLKSAFFALLCAAVIVCATGCATRASAPRDAASTAAPAPGSVLSSLPVDRELASRILALDAERISDNDVRNTLARGPTPRIMLLHGGIYPVHLAMVSFGRFLVGMGYPENRIRDPGDASWSYSPYENSEHLAGRVAWHYERDAMPPMLIGHSQGGIQAVKILDELAGQFTKSIPVWNPLTDAAEDRVTIIDPFTGRERPVVGITLSYASAVGAGGAALLLPNQWTMIGRLRTIPDTVVDFTGYLIGLDLVAWTVPGAEGASEFRHNGAANVRNVVLPAGYSHVTIPVVQPLARDPAAQEWINAYHPGDKATPQPPGQEGYALLWAADVWYDVKKHWCLEAQRLVRAKSAALAAGLP